MTDDQDGAPGSTPVPAPGARSPARSRSGRGPSWPAGGGRPAAGRPPRDGSRRTPDPSAAGQRMMRQIAATRRARRQRLVLVMTGLMSVLTLVLSGSAWLLTSYVTSSLGRVNAGTSGTPSSGPVNILVAGIDTRGGLTRHQEIELHVGNSISSNSDTLMLVHIPASHDSVQVVSLPRDSWVRHSRPRHEQDQRRLRSRRAAADGPDRGAGDGPAASTTTSRSTSSASSKSSTRSGGVNICVPFAVDDPYSGLDISAGRHHVDGITALEYRQGPALVRAVGHPAHQRSAAAALVTVHRGDADRRARRPDPAAGVPVVRDGRGHGGQGIQPGPARRRDCAGSGPRTSPSRPCRWPR